MQKEHLFWLFALALVGTAVLLGLGKLPPESWKMVIGGLGLWLAPSPIVKDVSK